MADSPIITAEYIRQLLHYDAETGVFTWRPRPASMFVGGKRPAAYMAATWNARFAGKPAGSVSKNGYVYFLILGEKRLAHRVAWLYVTGEWPKEQIDHENLIRHDNSFANLRPATSSQNGFNRSPTKRNKSGVKGVFWFARTRRWLAYVDAGRRRHYLGYFKNKADAEIAAKAARNELHQDFARG